MTNARQDMSSWPYGQPLSPSGPGSSQAQPSSGLPASDAPPDGPLLQAKGSTRQFTQQQIDDDYGPADWFPESHPPAPAIVAQGRRGEVRACALCHLADGRGRPDSASLQSLPVAYIVQQLRDFRQGLRQSADPRKADTAEMASIAGALTDDEIKQAAAYFSAIKASRYIRVVETDTVPATRLEGEIYVVTEGPEEPIGTRILETPDDWTETRLRNPQSGFTAYVPVGSIKRGEALVSTGGNGKTLACASCHGPDLRGFGSVPPIAGRSPSYLARQLYDIKYGTRRGPMAPLMMPVVEDLGDAEIVDVVAYVSSREP